LRRILLILFITIAASSLAACGSSNNGSAPAKAVEDYLTALVGKDADRIPTLVCGEWEEEALIELDSFQAVTTRLEGLACEQTGTDGETALVLCNGTIIASYNNEDQEIDLSVRTYQVTQVHEVAGLRSALRTLWEIVATPENIWAFVLFLIVIALIVFTTDSSPVWIYQGF
jgi:hypothetical protein